MRSLVLLLLLLLGLLPFRTEAQGTLDSGGCTFTAECSGWLFRDMFSSESIDYTNVDDMVKYYARVEWERARDYARTTMRVDGKCRFGNSVVESRFGVACPVACEGSRFTCRCVNETEAQAGHWNGLKQTRQRGWMCWGFALFCIFCTTISYKMSKRKGTENAYRDDADAVRGGADGDGDEAGAGEEEVVGYGDDRDVKDSSACVPLFAVLMVTFYVIAIVQLAIGYYSGQQALLDEFWTGCDDGPATRFNGHTVWIPSDDEGSVSTGDLLPRTPMARNVRELLLAFNGGSYNNATAANISDVGKDAGKYLPLVVLLPIFLLLAAFKLPSLWARKALSRKVALHFSCCKKDNRSLQRIIDDDDLKRQKGRPLIATTDDGDTYLLDDWILKPDLNEALSLKYMELGDSNLFKLVSGTGRGSEKIGRVRSSQSRQKLDSLIINPDSLRIIFESSDIDTDEERPDNNYTDDVVPPPAVLLEGQALYYTQIARLVSSSNLHAAEGLAAPAPAPRDFLGEKAHANKVSKKSGAARIEANAPNTKKKPGAQNEVAAARAYLANIAAAIQNEIPTSAKKKKGRRSSSAGRTQTPKRQSKARQGSVTDADIAKVFSGSELNHLDSSAISLPGSVTDGDIANVFSDGEFGRRTTTTTKFEDDAYSNEGNENEENGDYESDDEIRPVPEDLFKHAPSRRHHRRRRRRRSSFAENFAVSAEPSRPPAPIDLPDFVVPPDTSTTAIPTVAPQPSIPLAHPSLPLSKLSGVDDDDTDAVHKDGDVGGYNSVDEIKLPVRKHRPSLDFIRNGLVDYASRGISAFEDSESPRNETFRARGFQKSDASQPPPSLERDADADSLANSSNSEEERGSPPKGIDGSRSSSETVVKEYHHHHHHHHHHHEHQPAKYI